MAFFVLNFDSSTEVPNPIFFLLMSVSDYFYPPSRETSSDISVFSILKVQEDRTVYKSFFPEEILDLRRSSKHEPCYEVDIKEMVCATRT